MMPAFLRCLLLLGLCVAISAWAQEPKVIARASLENAEPVVAGQQVRLTVDALTNTFFTNAPTYPAVKLPNAIMTLLDERALYLNESIDNEQWSGVSRAYIITPTGDGDITIPPLELTLYPGQSETPMTATTQAITIKVKSLPRPAGTEKLLVSTEVKIQQTLDRKLDGLKVGDAITRTIEIQAAGAQGMLIPPVKFSKIAGLDVYPKTGTVDDKIKDRAGFAGGTRTDAATYVIQTTGNYTLPEITLEWWNPASGKSEKVSAPAIEFNAAANPNNAEFSLPQDTASKLTLFLNWHFIGLIASAALLLASAIYLLSHYLPRLLAYWHAWKAEQQARYAASELAAFKQLEQAIATGDAAQIYSALLNWAEHPENQQSLDDLCNKNPELATQINSLRTALFDTATPANPTNWDGSSLLQAATQLRQQKHSQSISGTHLRPLNPI
ncbi:BatD family protein [Cellvibrio sp. NN19]|uniref:BatD family protein n=1 Tax=Cellvibrio chitinivorans TaxID=3102792 RepID=UPI002B410AF5|nr:BatD family protein [Cellvibrio sp. NN19]